MRSNLATSAPSADVCDAMIEQPVILPDGKWSVLCLMRIALAPWGHGLIPDPARVELSGALRNQADVAVALGKVKRSKRLRGGERSIV
jgi:hypothetical protein